MFPLLPLSWSDTMSEISNRKKEHLEFAMAAGSQGQVSPGWGDIHLVPASLPTARPDAVDLSTSLCGHRLNAPFIFASMTGGHPDAEPINESLAIAAQTLGIGIGSGSQRAALRDGRLAGTYEIIRKRAPDAVVMANIGICQLVEQQDSPALSQRDIESVVEMLDAQFLIIHLNVVEELIQPEGDRNLDALAEALMTLTELSPVPVIAKETGSGMSRVTSETLVAAGVAVLDVGGAGGTSFARIEGLRAAAQNDALRARLGSVYADWGIPTAASLLEARDSGVPIIATGGVRSGLDSAKAIALGASVAGVGRPALAAALQGPQAVIDEMTAYIEELRLAVVLTGNRDLAGLRAGNPLITGRTKEWLMREHT